MDLESVWEAISQAVTAALDVLDQMRLTEGAALAADLAQSLDGIRREADRIQSACASALEPFAFVRVKGVSRP